LVAGALVLVGVAVIASSSDDVSLRASDYYNDAAMLRLRDDAYISMLTDTTLKEAAKDVGREEVEKRVMADVQRMTYDIPNYDVDKVSRIAEEKLIYDHSEIRQLQLDTARRLSPTLTLHKMPQVAELEHKLTNHIMSVLTAEARREIDAMVSGTAEPPQLQAITKRRLMRKTQHILEQEVKYRVARFINARLEHNVKEGLDVVLDHLKKTVKTQQQSEINAAEEKITDAEKPATTATMANASPVLQVAKHNVLKLAGAAAGGSTATASGSTTATAAPAKSDAASVSAQSLLILILSAVVLAIC
jgi:macrodomain Ter protein organizer (MatP/YcbG family)